MFLEENGHEKSKFLNLNIEKELDLHISGIWSTYEYYNLTQYELQTPTVRCASTDLRFPGSDILL